MMRFTGTLFAVALVAAPAFADEYQVDCTNARQVAQADAALSADAYFGGVKRAAAQDLVRIHGATPTYTYCVKDQSTLTVVQGFQKNVLGDIQRIELSTSASTFDGLKVTSVEVTVPGAILSDLRTVHFYAPEERFEGAQARARFTEFSRLGALGAILAGFETRAARGGALVSESGSSKQEKHLPVYKTWDLWAKYPHPTEQNFRVTVSATAMRSHAGTSLVSVRIGKEYSGPAILPVRP